MAFELIKLNTRGGKPKSKSSVRAASIYLNDRIYIRFTLGEEILTLLTWKDNISLDVAEGTNEDHGVLKFFRVVGNSGLKISKTYKGNNYEFRLNTWLLNHHTFCQTPVGIHDLLYEYEDSTLTVMLSPELLAKSTEVAAKNEN